MCIKLASSQTNSHQTDRQRGENSALHTSSSWILHCVVFCHVISLCVICGLCTVHMLHTLLLVSTWLPGNLRVCELKLSLWTAVNSPCDRAVKECVQILLSADKRTVSVVLNQDKTCTRASFDVCVCVFTLCPALSLLYFLWQPVSWYFVFG